MPTFASLFSGGGGAELGAIAAGFKPVWAVEIDPKIAEVYAANLANQPLVKSVAQVNIKAIDRPDVLWASPPCQQWSVARSKKLSERNDADIGLAIVPYLELLQPPVFMLENVEGYRRAKCFQVIVNTLHLLGYWTSWEVINMADYGIPQTRRRLLLRAVKGSFVPSMPQSQKWRGWYGAIANLIPCLPESEFASWQLQRMRELTSTALVEGHNTIRQNTVRLSNQPSPCVTAHWMHRPSITPRAFIVEGKRVVIMTPRALAKFQTFPDSYQLPESRTLACRVIGNAVPPLMATKLIEGINYLF